MFALFYMHPVHGFSVCTEGVYLHATECLHYFTCILCMVLVCVQKVFACTQRVFVLFYMHPVHGFSVRIEGVCLHATGCLYIHVRCSISACVYDFCKGVLCLIISSRSVDVCKDLSVCTIKYHRQCLSGYIQLLVCVYSAPC